MKLRVSCPAKLNLFLAVGPPDERHYHPVRTVLQTISLTDTMSVTVAQKDSFTCNWTDLPKENTVTKAWRLAAEIISLPPLDIHLHKEIPEKSGMGGGSSDAAGLLRAIEIILPGRIKPNELQDIAAAIGMDVPFFLVGGRAQGEHYGEKLTSLPKENTFSEFVIAMPKDTVSSAEAYTALDDKPRPFQDFPSHNTLYNDFERVAPPSCIDLIANMCAAGAMDAGLTGSGSAVFGRFYSPDAAKAAAERLQKEGYEFCRHVKALDRAESLHIDTI